MEDPDELFASLDETPDEYSQRMNHSDQLEQDSNKAATKREYAEQLLANLDSEEPSPLKKPRMDDAKLDVYDDSELTKPIERTITVHSLVSNNQNCSHEVAYPPNMAFEPLRTMNVEPAKTYPFQLDGFQREAINCIENNQSVLVSAHTSAGKTVVALYAIAQGLRDKQRVIYTSPIKALSNQKYRELEEEFKDVGLMTGDVTLNPEASCLVMTTEILRSMLYKGSELAREVGWVIFDEIHYMRDKERGVVWEEAIILLQTNVKCVFLSATIPNARQFAEWICMLKMKPCHVIYTDYRPTPLLHLIYPTGGTGLYEVVNIKGEFKEDRFQQAMACIEASDKSKGGMERGKKGGNKGGNESNVNLIIRTIKDHDLVPAIVFSFSRKDCEAYALGLKDMDFTSAEEKQTIKVVYQSAIDLLSDEDRKLPQISQILPFLTRGIGVHHSGLLPIIKEIVEILFGEGLLRVLFATETFSMGLNMPAKTVVFTSARKYDGKDFRWITSGEYIQMSGRAGRRGKDDKGMVIMMIDQQMSADDARRIIKGATDPLNSQFRLTYNMILNLLRVEGINPEFMLERSFYQFQNNGTIPVLQKKLLSAQQVVEGMHVEQEQALTGYFELEKTVSRLKEDIRKTIMRPQYIVPFLRAGRLLNIKTPTCDFGWGVLIDFKKKVNPDDRNDMLFILDVLLRVSVESLSLESPKMVRPPTDGQKSCWEMIPMTIECINEISAARIPIPKSLKTPEERSFPERVIQECKDRFDGKLPLLEPIADMKINDPRLKENIEKLAQHEARLRTHEIRLRDDFEELAKRWREKEEKRQEAEALRKELKKAMSLLQLEELGFRKRVLRRLQYCDQGDIVLDKGRVACEISASDELLLTEMIFSGVFTSLTVEEIAALISCFVFQEKAPTPKMAENLSGCLRQIQEHAHRIASVSNECKVELDEEEYVNSFKPGLMEIVHKWASGKSFQEVVGKGEVFEGSIIRCLRRLEEALREVTAAALNMGNKELSEKFNQARTAIKRDIVFAASLYL